MIQGRVVIIFKKKSAFILLSDFCHQLGLVTWLTINEGHLHSLHFLPSFQGNHNSRLLEQNWVIFTMFVNSVGLHNMYGILCTWVTMSILSSII